MKLYDKFLYGLRWNAVESVLYYITFLLHQFFLYRCTSHELYGLISTIFALIYIGITISNMGLDISLGTFLTIVTKSKQHFRSLLIPQLILEALLILFVLGISYGILNFIAPQLLYALDFRLIIILAAITCLEGLRKTVRLLLQLVFFNKITTLTELITLILYCVTVWSYYGITKTISLFTIFIPMLFIVSIGGLCALSYCLYCYYSKLPDTHKKFNTSIYYRISINRAFNYLYQVSTLFFSTNFLVPLFAARFGLSHAALFNVTSTIVRTIAVILQKMFGTTSNAWLAHIKETTIEMKRAVFFSVSTILYQFLYCIIIFFGINGKKLLLMNSLSLDVYSYAIAYLFLIMFLTDNFCLIYEKFYIIEEKTYYLLFFNGITLTFGYVILYNTALSLLHILLLLTSIRLTTFILIMLFSSYQWQLQSNWHIKPRYLICSLIISATVFFFL